MIDAIDVRDSDVPEPGHRIAWILECGCEPMFEHCGQCDGRRAARSRVEARERLEKQADQLRAAGYTVSAPSGETPRSAE